MKNDDDVSFDPTRDNIIIISYPPGGLGHCMYYVLSAFAAETIKISKPFKFGPNGDAHCIQPYTKKYFHRPKNYEPTIRKNYSDQLDKKILVLADNEYYDQYDEIREIFPNATVVRMVVTPDVQYIVQAMLHTKNRLSRVHLESLREQSHPWLDGVFDYSGEYRVVNVCLRDLYIDMETTIRNLITNLGMSVVNENQLKQFCAEWYRYHQKYLTLLTLP